MNLKEHCLDEIELHSSLIDEGIACLLHTILIVRAPGNHFASPSLSFLPSFLLLISPLYTQLTFRSLPLLYIARFVPEDVECRRLSPLVYAKCGGEDVGNSVIRALQQLRESLEEVGETHFKSTDCLKQLQPFYSYPKIHNYIIRSKSLPRYNRAVILLVERK